MMAGQGLREPAPSAWWVPFWAVVAAAAALVMRLPYFDGGLWWLLPAALAVPSGFIAVVVTFVGAAPDRAALHRVLAVVAGAVWVTIVDLAGWGPWLVVALVVGGMFLGGLELVYGVDRTPQGAPLQLSAGVDAPRDRRPQKVQEYEALLRRITSQKALTVQDVRPWADAANGERVYLDLPEGMTVKELAAFCDKIAASPQLRLPQGCAVRALDGEHQCEAVLDVMLRDCLADTVTITEATGPTSINEPFEVVTSPRGEQLKICLREESAVVGGTTNSGKTTLLHRIIMRLARSIDALIWVIDLNGGGLAAPWVEPWARGLAPRPTVDWVADNEAEGAVMIAVALAIAKDRKTSGEAARRKKAANTTVLPVDADMPAIVILTDEGGEVRQAAGLFGQMVAQGISRVAQIGRAEGVRVVLSVLRGTADLLDKGFRAVAGLRICLRMAEEGEADHILGVNPGRTKLRHKGSAYLYRTAEDQRPILARTVNVLLDQIGRHAIATAALRPDLDERGQRVAARVSMSDVIGGREVDPILARLPIMEDVAAGRAYSGRWDRKRAVLAQMRGEEVQVEELAAPTKLGSPTIAAEGSAMEKLLLAGGQVLTVAEPSPVNVADAVSVEREADALLSADHWDAPAPRRPATTREHILRILSESYPAELSSAQIGQALDEARASVSRQTRQDMLKSLREAGLVIQEVEQGPYRVPGV